MYDIAHPRHTLHFLRDKQEHALRRRDWRRSFSAHALETYRPRIEFCAEQLLNAIDDHAQKRKPINAALYFNLFSFDAMGLLGFGHSFSRLAEGKMNYYMKNLHKNTLLAGTFFQTPWVMQILKQMTPFNAQYVNFIAYSKRMTDERIQTPSHDSTIFGPLLDAYKIKNVKTEHDRQNLYGDADLIVVAGSDTIAAALSCACFELAQHPRHNHEIQHLLDLSRNKASLDGAREIASKQAHEYINAVIRETLRLHPVIASGLQRITPSEGLWIGEAFIPGGVRVQTPTYVMHRDPRFFAQPDEFIPERWTSQTDLVLDASLYVPFNTGLYSCIGKQLAMMELEHVIRELCDAFNWELPQGNERARKAFERTKRDTFTLFVRDLDMVFKRRSNTPESSP